MPLFLFHLRTPEGFEPDDTGLDLPDLETAYLEACRTIPGMAADLVREGKSPLPYGFVIVDAAGNELMEVPFSERLDDGRPLRRPGQRASRTSAFEQIIRARQLISEICEQASEIVATAEATQEALACGRQILWETRQRPTSGAS